MAIEGGRLLISESKLSLMQTLSRDDNFEGMKLALISRLVKGQSQPVLILYLITTVTHLISLSFLIFSGIRHRHCADIYLLQQHGKWNSGTQFHGNCHKLIVTHFRFTLS